VFKGKGFTIEACFRDFGFVWFYGLQGLRVYGADEFGVLGFSGFRGERYLGF